MRHVIYPVEQMESYKFYYLSLSISLSLSSMHNSISSHYADYIHSYLPNFLMCSECALNKKEFKINSCINRAPLEYLFYKIPSFCFDRQLMFTT